MYMPHCGHDTTTRFGDSFMADAKPCRHQIIIIVTIIVTDMTYNVFGET